MNNKLLVAVPFYNCEHQITRVLDNLVEFRSHIDFDVIFINNRSTDDGLKNLENRILMLNFQKCKVFNNHDNYGLGGSQKIAFEYANISGYHSLIILHGDNQANVLDILPFLPLSGNYDCMLGARFMMGSALIGYSKTRILVNRVLNLFFSIISRCSIYDLGSGLNFYNLSKIDIKKLLCLPNDLTFNYSLILHQILLGQKIFFFPISWTETDQISNVKVVSQMIKVIKIAMGYLLGHKIYKIENRGVYSYSISGNED